MSLLQQFAEALKAKLHAVDKDDLMIEENPYANGDTECGFYPDPPKINMEELDRQIDQLVAEFAEKNKSA